MPINGKLRGIIPPLVTPMQDWDVLDVPGLERLVAHVVEGGAHGVFILGTTGEGPSLSGPLQREMIERTTRLVGGRVPVLVGITHTSFGESVAISHFSATAGVDALVVAPPPYFPVLQSELCDYIRRLVPQLPLPVFLYNMPSLTKVWFEPDTVAELTSLEGLIGLKDSSNDLEYFRAVRKIVSHTPHWSLFVGPEHLLADAVALGADGGVCGGANLWPRLFTTLYEAASAGDLERVQQLQEFVERLGQIYLGSDRTARVIPGLKEALSQHGLCQSRTAPPLHGADASHRERIRQFLTEHRAPLTALPDRVGSATVSEAPLNAVDKSAVPELSESVKSPRGSRHA